MKLLTIATAKIALSSANVTAADAQTPEAFYKGKTVNVLISHAPGGGFDLYGRLFTKHLSKVLIG